MSGASDFHHARDFLLTHRADYETAYKTFSWPRLDKFNWALDHFDPMACGQTRTALWVVDESGAEVKLSFAEMAERSNRVANYLRQLGVRRGDRILVMLGNEPPLWEILLAAFKLGAVVIPSSTLLNTEDIEDRLERGSVRHIVVGTANAGKFAAIGGGCTLIAAGGHAPPGWLHLNDAYGEPASFTPDGPTLATDPLLLYFTSGTTSRPKLVLHSHQSYPVGHLSTMYWLGLQPGDVHWNISSPGWAKHAWSCFFVPWTAGATAFVYNYSRFRAQDALAALVRHSVTTICAPPTVWRQFIQEKLADYPVKLREAVSAGEPLNPEVLERVRTAWGLTLRDAYGQTETTALVGNPPGQPVKAGSMGRPLPGFRIELVDGEICIDLASNPVGLMSGYTGDDGRTADSMREGYYHTGDIGTRDEDGYITYVGRADDVFKASDYRISPFELESVMIEHPAVAEAAVVPSPDARRFAVPKVFVVLAAGYVPDADVARDLFLFIRQRLASYKRIRRLEFADLPKTISGKIRRAQLREMEYERGAGSARRPTEFFEEDFEYEAARGSTKP